MARSMHVVLAAALLTSAALTQTVLITDDFSSASGSTPPAGWSTSYSLGLVVPPELNGWVFDNPGGRAFPPPFFEPFAIVDSDFAGFGSSQDAVMDSPEIDVSGAGTIYLHLEQTHRAAGGSTVEISVFDGSTYNAVHSSSVSSPNAATTMESDPLAIDITAAAGGASHARVRFRYTGSFGWWWALDDFEVIEPSAGLDVGVTAILAPVFADQCGALPAANVVTIEVTNFAAGTLAAGSTVPVAFRVDGGAAVTEIMTLTTSLPTGAAANHMFTATADFSAPGTHVLDAFTSVAGDTAPGNDLASAAYTALPSTTPPYTEDFDSVGSGTTPPAGWINEQGENSGGLNADWYFSTGGTPSLVGPPADHTSGSGTFAFIEDSLASSHPVINLLSSCIDLTGAVAPALVFWVWSHDAMGPSNALSVDVIQYPGGAVTPDVVGPIGNLADPNWRCRGSGLAAFNGSVIRLVFRGRNDNLGNFAHDFSLDDVTVDDLAAGGGQPPSPGIAVLDISGALVGGCLGVGSGLPGPYFSSVIGGTSVTFGFEGAPNQAIVLLEGLLNPGNAAFPILGILDLGTATLAGISLVADGSAGGFFNSLFIVGPAGTSAITLPAPLALVGQTFDFQGAIFNPMVGPRFTNAVSLAIL